MKLIRRARRRASDCLPESEPLPPMPDDKPCRRVCLMVEGITIEHQQRLYVLLVEWDNCRYAQGWAIPVHLVKRFCVDFRNASQLMPQDWQGTAADPGF